MGKIAGLRIRAPRTRLLPQAFRVNTLIDQGADAVDDAGTVFAVSDAEPGIGRAEHLDLGFAGVDELADGHGDVAFRLELFAAALKEAVEDLAELREDGGGESPVVHGNGLVTGEVGDRAVRGGVLCTIAVALDAGELFDALEVALGADLAHAARDGAEVGQGVAQDEA